MDKPFILDLLKEKFQKQKLPVPKINDIGGKYYASKIDGLTVWYVADYIWIEIAGYGCLEKNISNICSTVEYGTLPDYQKKYYDEALARIKKLVKEGHAAVRRQDHFADNSTLVVSPDKKFDVINNVDDYQGINEYFEFDDPDDYTPKRESYPRPPGYVDLSGALSQVNDKICKYVDLDPLAAVVVALWIVYTWLSSNFYINPLLIISTDDEHNDNVSMLFSLLLKLSYQAVKVSAISKPLFFNRTLLFDDPTVIKNRNMLNKIINSYRCDEAQIMTAECKGELTAGAKALASYGSLPNSIKCHGIVLDLTQRNSSNRAARLTYLDIPPLLELKDYISRITKGLNVAVRNEKPVMPDCLSNSEQDNWEPLFKIAMIAGGDWPDKVTQAATLLSAVKNQEGHIRGLLLSDIHEIVHARKSDRIRTFTLISRLCEKNGELWGKYDRGGEISSVQLAELLKPFGVKSKLMRFNDLEKPVKHGYLKSRIVNAYQLYAQTTAK